MQTSELNQLDKYATEVKIMALSDGSVFVGVEYRKGDCDMKNKYQEIPKFDQKCDMVVQLEPEVKDDCVYYPCQIVKIPAEQLEENVDIIEPVEGKIIIDEKVMPAKVLPVSKIGLCKKIDIEAAGFELREVEPVIIKDPIEIVKDPTIDELKKLPTLDAKI